MAINLSRHFSKDDIEMGRRFIYTISLSKNHQKTKDRNVDEDVGKRENLCIVSEIIN